METATGKPRDVKHGTPSRKMEIQTQKRAQVGKFRPDEGSEENRHKTLETRGGVEDVQI